MAEAEAAAAQEMAAALFANNSNCSKHAACESTLHGNVSQVQEPSASETKATQSNKKKVNNMSEMTESVDSGEAAQFNKKKVNNMSEMTESVDSGEAAQSNKKKVNNMPEITESVDSETEAARPISKRVNNMPEMTESTDKTKANDKNQQNENYGNPYPAMSVPWQGYSYPYGYHAQYPGVHVPPNLPPIPCGSFGFQTYKNQPLMSNLCSVPAGIPLPVEDEKNPNFHILSGNLTNGPQSDILDISNNVRSSELIKSSIQLTDDCHNEEELTVDIIDCSDTETSTCLYTSASDLKQSESACQSPLTSTNNVNCGSDKKINSSHQCIDCLIKDNEIKDLKEKIKELTKSRTSANSINDCETPKQKQYRPKTRPTIEFADFITIDSMEEIPDGYQQLALGAPLAIRSLWLHDILASIGRQRSKREKKASKKGQKPKEDQDVETIKRLLDGFFDPWELAVDGGTNAFKDSPIYKSLKLYASHVLKMDEPKFKRAWNTKMVTSRQTIKRLKKSKNSTASNTESESEFETKTSDIDNVTVELC